MKFTVLDEKTVVASYQGKQIRHYIDNAYTDYSQDTASLGSILSRYVASAAELYSSDEGQTMVKENIVPIIKSIEYLGEMDKMAGEMGAKKKTAYVYDKYNEQLIVLYAFDSKNGIHYLLADNLDSLGMKRDSLRPLAIRNLKRILPDIQIRGDSGKFMFTAGGNYEASLILFPDLWTRENLPVDGDFVIAIPNRDVLLITGSKDKGGIEKLKGFATKSYATGNYSVSESLYKWDGKRFALYE